ncbi:MAG TPA: hypothetical protein VNA65_01590 [Candidatus Dormibacteraeota bacterium]|nr:hypothetical protein [Candidatus Dormibacteraeota bacterium]
MKAIHRVVITGVGSVLIALATAVAATAAGFLGPGHFDGDFASASGFWVTNTAYVVQASVDRNTFVFRPTEGNPQEPITQHATILQVTIKAPTFVGQDCFVIPDQDFVLANGVQSATLTTKVDVPNRCPGFPTPLASVLAGGGKGGPPPIPGIPLPMTLSLSWTGNGVTQSTSDQSRMSCDGLRSENQNTLNVANGSADGTLTFQNQSPVALPASVFAAVNQGTFMSNVQGSPSPLCFGK